MSLLIDALKQAEAQRKQAQDEAAGSSLSLSPVEAPEQSSGGPAAAPETPKPASITERAPSPAAQPRTTPQRTPSHNAAQTASRELFEVKQAESSLSPLVWIGAGALVLALLGGGYVWWQIQPRGMSAPNNTTPIAVPAAPLNTQAAAPAVEIEPLSPPTTPITATPTPARAPAQTSILRSVPANSIRVAQRAEAPPAAPAIAAAPAVNDAPANRDAAVSFQRTPQASASSPAQRAFEAYQSGDFELARQRYREALRSEPKNTDVLNALGMLALRDGQTDVAERSFRQTLTVNPKDALANSQLAVLYGEGDAVSAESRLRNLIANQPESASAHFALGSLMARQSRWREAQQMFFQAHTLDGGDADTLFNLAVSLDRLQQGRLALQYYERALAAQTTRPAAFDRDAVRRRVQSLGASLNTSLAAPQPAP